MWGIGFNEVWTSDEEFEIHPFSLYSYGLDHVEGCHTHVPGQTLKREKEQYLGLDSRPRSHFNP